MISDVPPCIVLPRERSARYCQRPSSILRSLPAASVAYGPSISSASSVTFCHVSLKNSFEAELETLAGWPLASRVRMRRLAKCSVSVSM